MENYNKYLVVDNNYNNTNTRVTKVKKTNYGYRVQMFNHYVTLFYLKIIIDENKSAKIHWLIDKNYQPKQRFTTYYGCDCLEISRKEYQQLNK